MKAKTIQVCGTGSGVGKSIIVTAFCRIFLQDDYRVAPFKAQNMALNSFVTDESGEMGRAQAVQARACRIEPSVNMNPILIKPTSDQKAQIILSGRPIGNMSARQYINYKPKLTEVIKTSFNKLLKNYEIVVIEGAGSPAEINLKSHDFVNMKMAKYARAPVILVGDIDKGGVFAWIIGTLELLSKQEKEMVKGIIINKFRGDKSLLNSGIDFLERRTGIKVLGVIPYFKDISIPEEDGIFYHKEINSVRKPTRWAAVKMKYSSFSRKGGGVKSPALSNGVNSTDGQLKIGIINLPHIANHTDFDNLKKEDVDFSYIDKPADLEELDIVVLPGTKNTIEDMKFLRNKGFETAIKKHVDKKKFLVGICGGFQMLGKIILDPLSIESKEKNIEGLGYFDFHTVFESGKITEQIKASFIKYGLKITGYEIHHGRTIYNGTLRPMFIIEKRGKKNVKINDGTHTKDFQIWGTHIHGIFDNYNFRKWFFDLVRKKLGLPRRKIEDNLDSDQEIDKLANLVRKNINMVYLYKILNKNV